MSDTTAADVSNDVIAKHSRAYGMQKLRCDQENGVLRNIVKMAKKDGVNTKMMIEVYQDKKKDPEVVVAEERDRIRYLSIGRIDIRASDLFEGWQPGVTDKTRAEDDIWHAEETGFKA